MTVCQKCIALVDSYLERQKKPGAAALQDDTKSVVIDMLVDPASAKGHTVPTPDELSEEIIMLLSAGNDTTSDALIIGLYQICRNPEILGRMEKELGDAYPNVHDTDAINYENSRNLPYLVRDGFYHHLVYF